MNNFELHDKALELSLAHSGYALARRLIIAESERDALASHLTLLESVERDETEYGRTLMDILDCSPETSLVCLKAESAKRHFLYGYGFCRMNGFLFDEDLQAAGDEYARRQAERGE